MQQGVNASDNSKRLRGDFTNRISYAIQDERSNRIRPSNSDAQRLPMSSARHADIGAAAVSVQAAGIATLREAFSGPFGREFDRAVHTLLTRPGRAILTGMGKSGHIARKIAATFSSTGTPAYFVHPAEASHGDLGMIHADDTVIALSWSGESSELAPLISYTRRFDIALIAITSDGGSALGSVADVCLAVPPVEEACPNRLAPTTSTLVQLALGDSLAVALLHARGFTASDFAIYHPGGKLGAQLMRVSEIMRPLSKIGCVGQGAKMGEATVAMSQWNTGFVLITNDNMLVGIITDGDLRRHMGADLMARSVADIMTRNPATLPLTMLTGEAVRFLNDRNITAAPVLDAGVLVGAVHLNDLIRAGIA
ncbi:MAG: KpsF/GutQ family sugar-phosphate isomerase [Pseudomonadota bacterium]|nr:KpsF/GutQ family sugar-phosphate isomerase [Pseudomonadota bacterium]